MSVWESAEALGKFVFQTVHRNIYARKHEFFEMPDKPTVVMWWIPSRSHPDLGGSQGAARPLHRQRSQRIRLRLGRSAVGKTLAREAVRLMPSRKLIIDGKEIEADDNLTLLQACESAGAEIPRFCYHERLSVAGNCRMCLVEWVGAPKPQASCALQVRDIFPNKDGTPAKINTNIADRPQGARRRDGIPADQPSARLPDLRPGRRVRSAGPGDGLWPRRLQPLPREQARGRRQIYGPAGQDRS